MWGGYEPDAQKISNNYAPHSYARHDARCYWQRRWDAGLQRIKAINFPLFKSDLSVSPYRSCIPAYMSSLGPHSGTIEAKPNAI